MTENLVKELKIEIETLKTELQEAGLMLHATHSQHGSSFQKFVKGQKEKLVEDWKNCSYTFCKNRYNLAYSSRGQNG